MRTLLIGLSFVISVVLITGASLLWLPALTFQFFALGLAALEWSPWFLLAALIVCVLAIISWRTHPRLARLSLLFGVVAALLIGQRLFVTLRTPVQIWSNMAEVSAITPPTFDLQRFVFGSTVDQPGQVQRDIVYANVDGVTLSMDVYQPQLAQPTPSIVVIHGGSWRGGVKGDFQAVTQHWVAQGYTVFDLNYRLAPEHRFPAAIEDVYCALQFIEDHHQRWNVDPAQTVLVGRSAGAQIALVAGYSFDEPVFATRCAPTATTIRGIVGYYAPTRLDYHNPIKPSLSPGSLDDYLGGAPEDHPLAYERARPANWVDRAVPPTLLLHGGRDQFVRPRDTWELAEALDREDQPFVAIELPYANHGFDYIMWGPSNQLVQPYVDQFLASILSQL